MSSMLKASRRSYYVVINTERGAITPEMRRTWGGFIRHLAINCGRELSTPMARMQHPSSGAFCFSIDRRTTPFGYLAGRCRLIRAAGSPDRGELTELPQLGLREWGAANRETTLHPRER